ncbi:MAG: cytochrome P450 [Beijerinckiaceae bacterium]|nr:MAG: cytochrome P450 [Beijerinckiaceae bacterium]
MLATLRRNPVETWTEAHFEHLVLSGRTILGRAAVVSAPDGIRRILVENAGNYSKDALQRRILAPGLGDGLLTARDVRWRVQRRAIAPLFSPKNVLSFGSAMAEAADALVSRWLRRRDGTIIDVQKAMARVTLDTLQRTILTGGLGRTPDEFLAALTQYFESIGQLDPFDLLDFPAWLPRITRIRSRRSLTFFNDAVETILARRKALLTAEPQNAPQDLLTLLLQAQSSDSSTGLTEAEVRANIVTFIGAGHETTANALTWTLFLLAHSPEWQERLAKEADSLAGASSEVQAQSLVETRAVVEEAIRLYPPVASLSRAAVGPDDIHGHRIRKGTLVMIVPWILHRHRRLWTDPDVFDPRRFLPGARETIDRFAYLPFGAGPRVCIGASFALQEAAIVLTRIMRQFSLSPVAEHDVTPVQHITLRPKGGMPLIVKRRRGAIHANG